MIERHPKLYYSVPLRRVELDGGKVVYCIDTRDLAPLAHRQHKHLLAAVRAVLQRDGFAGGEIIARRFVGRNGKMLTRFLLTERGIDRVLEHLKNRMGLDKVGLIVRLRVAFDRAVHGFVDPPLVDPAPDSEIRPPEVETALDLEPAPAPAAADPAPPDPPPPVDPPRHPGPVALDAGYIEVLDFVGWKAAEEASAAAAESLARSLSKDPAPAVLDLDLQRAVNSAVLLLSTEAVGAPAVVLVPLCQWHAEQIEEAWRRLGSWGKADGLAS